MLADALEVLQYQHGLLTVLGAVDDTPRDAMQDVVDALPAAVAVLRRIGSSEWHANIGSSVASPTVVDDTIYAVSDELYALSSLREVG